MTKKLDPKRIRKGDLVKITGPAFARVGYFLEPNEVLDELMEINFRRFHGNPKLENLAAALKEFGIVPKGKDRLISPKLLQAIVYELCGSWGMGGRVRQVFTEEVPKYVGQEVYVTSTFCVQIGRYYPPAGGRDYEGEYWYKPGGLDGQKTVKVIETQLLRSLKTPLSTRDVVSGRHLGLCFPVTSVEKIC